jgi:hypothetical protein
MLIRRLKMKGVAESSMAGILKQERFKPRYAGKAVDRKTGTQLAKVHATSLLKATIDNAS